MKHIIIHILCCLKIPRLMGLFHLPPSTWMPSDLGDDLIPHRQILWCWISALRPSASNLAESMNYVSHGGVQKTNVVISVRGQRTTLFKSFLSFEKLILSKTNSNQNKGSVWFAGGKTCLPFLKSIWGAVEICYTCLVCFWRVIVFWGGHIGLQGFVISGTIMKS